jgi:hypothetical protein
VAACAAPPRPPPLDPLRHRDEIAGEPIKVAQTSRKLCLKYRLRPEQVLPELLLHGPLRSFGSVHQRDNPLQSGFGCFEQLAEHLRA